MAAICLGVCPLPPPLHGFSDISRRVVESLANVGVDVRVTDTSPAARGWRAPLISPLRTIKRLVLFVVACQQSKPTVLYLALSGGARQLIDLIYLLIARCFRLPTYVHHHSFRYLNRPSRLTGLVLQAAPAAKHILLCNCMAARLVSVYGVDERRLHIVSNAAFLKIERPDRPPPGQQPLRVGYFSAVSREKGIYTYLATLAAFRAAGGEAVGQIAGSVNPHETGAIGEALAAADDVEAIGLVTGAEKTAFLRSLDVLLFPSEYPNEAEPVAVLEAMAAGVAVVARERGCIAELAGGAAAVVPADENFAARAGDLLRILSADPARLQDMKSACRRRFDELTADATTAWTALAREMAAGGATGDARPS